ncbi:MAG TPA: hypothetical protein VGB08_00920 [Allosphingosinicella sp.]
MFDNFFKSATAAVCSLLLTTLAVGASVDGHAATTAAATVYAAADAGETANV